MIHTLVIILFLHHVTTKAGSDINIIIILNKTNKSHDTVVRVTGEPISSQHWIRIATSLTFSDNTPSDKPTTKTKTKTP